MIILRQQYLSKPNSSKILLGSSPAADFRSNSSYLSPTTLPQLKHLTGIIVQFYSWLFLEWFSLSEKPMNLFYSLSIVFITLALSLLIFQLRDFVQVLSNYSIIGYFDRRSILTCIKNNEKENTFSFYGFTRVIVLGNAMASLIVSNPHIHMTTRATPMPKPE